MTVPSDRRTSPRVAFRVPAHVTTISDQRLYKGYVMNLSENGAFVMLTDPVQLANEEVRIRFTIGGDTHCDGAGRIARVMRMGTGPGFGVELTLVNQAFVNFIRNLRSADEEQLMFFIRDMRRIEIWLGFGLLPQ